MKFIETPLKGAFEIQLQAIEDDRGAFLRSWSLDVFQEMNLETQWVQSNISYNHIRGTLRGMHYQAPPYEEVKLLRCARGAIFDVIVDIRPDSPTYLRWHGVELSAENYKMLYIPHGFAHGFQTLSDQSEVLYQMSAYYHADSARGLRWDDPLLNITWPLAPTCISQRDKQHAYLSSERLSSR